MLAVVTNAALDSFGFLVAMNGAGAVCVAVMIASFSEFYSCDVARGDDCLMEMLKRMQRGDNGDSGGDDITVMLCCRCCVCHV